MTTNTKILTIPALCARLGYPEEKLVCSCGEKMKFSIKEGAVWLNSVCGNGRKILSINDEFPTDICETCGGEAEEHKGRGHPDNHHSHPFKPLLAKITAIKLVERCEGCGCDLSKRGNLACCLEYKPIQVVKITYGEEKRR